MVLKLKKRCMAFFAILILIQFSDVLSIHKKNKMEKNNLRKLQTIATTPFTTLYTTPYTTPNSTESSKLSPNNIKKSNRGLSSGAIVAIVVPCVAALISLGALSALYKSTPAVAAAVAPAQAGVPNDIDASLVRMTLQNQPVVQEVPVVQQPSDVVQQTASVVKEAVEPVTVVNDTVV